MKKYILALVILFAATSAYATGQWSACDTPNPPWYCKDRPDPRECTDCPPGPEGPQGETGETGPAGNDGQDGATGSTGATGNSGSDGASGASGAVGAAGSAGTVGAIGATGPQGETGLQGLAGRDADVDKLRAGIAGVMASAQIESPLKGEYLVGIGAAGYRGEAGFAIGGAKNWITNRKDITEIMLKGSAFFDDQGGVGYGGSLNFHF